VVAPAPRATLLKLPSPRGALVKLPQCKIGEQRLVELPNGIQALARYKARLANEGMLATGEHSIGDTWAVGENLWIWLYPVGGSAPTWIDP